MKKGHMESIKKGLGSLEDYGGRSKGRSTSLEEGCLTEAGE